MKKKSLIIIGMAMSLLMLGCQQQIGGQIEEKTALKITGKQRIEQHFLSDGLTTNTSKSAIDLKKILDGGPGKDGIPAISDPKFTSVQDAPSTITDEALGILVMVGKTTRFYPYTILVWHEIINDEIEGKPLAITFCPLCASAIVFDRKVNGEVLEFGVSGKLYESNLLMFDRKTESLWSQIIGKAVVGEYTGTELTRFPFQLLPWKTVKKDFSNAEILSTDTGYSRDYTFYPYGDYDTNDEVYFPISVKDQRLPPKTILVIVNLEDHSVAFPYNDLKAVPEASVEVNGKKLIAKRTGDQMEFFLNGKKEDLSSYFAMFFSWAIHHQEDGILWNKP